MSASATSPATRSDHLLLPLPTEDFELEFRVVARGGIRRGIRLERAFWVSLKQMAESRKCTIGMLVDEIAEGHAEKGNLTSAIRVACIRELGRENLNLRRLASIRTINAILLACPSPAFALASTKKIVTFNAPFQQLVKRQLPAAFDEDTRQDLKLALDLNVADIFARLDTNGDVAVASGFVIGAGERRYRGQLNVVRAPVLDLELLMAFVFNG
ncbi:ribbon-helix-helix domain-containing protein [Mesorhizobium sp. ESP6-5]|uniref:ribbon-helix-helix domain-containing protein n=1 Tax=unclassified Mesorhizobium TaxID=325217 RepID=UPI0011284E82|nr:MULTISPECIES: ribbon-helix-helix domain-containing protein [unclassified Mesorhizobium]MBZ9933302.1 ribbon-helix-helix domain-containing protein [Mesorhizobium sp. BR1-1-5]MBZ9694967.1 ribbon-helix-helix domain-containing protein [Mesorhizobium sp. CO1-1-9]MBZ9755827.1 ribbon-helix-helix domain-containing protein [Mesorhizobium sp. ESP6-5]MBZ9909380.1 ribbon-helix-helix domain-containing protein [Mesorhizobium sp. BR115XR7A]MBZ9977976.1 ribbon-helix-helix domain-containing protein [Mesorhiz